jgi:hypothetical protein
MRARSSTSASPRHRSRPPARSTFRGRGRSRRAGVHVRAPCRKRAVSSGRRARLARADLPALEHFSLTPAGRESLSGGALPPVERRKCALCGPVSPSLQRSLSAEARTCPGLPLPLASLPCPRATGRVSLGLEGEPRPLFTRCLAASTAIAPRGARLVAPGLRRCGCGARLCASLDDWHTIGTRPSGSREGAGEGKARRGAALRERERRDSNPGPPGRPGRGGGGAPR